MRLISTFLIYFLTQVSSNLCYSQSLSYPQSINDSTESEYAFAIMRSNYQFIIYYEDRSEEDFIRLMKLKLGKGHFNSYDSIMSIHFKLLKYMRAKGFELLNRQLIKGDKINMLGSDLEYEFVFRRPRRKK